MQRTALRHLAAFAALAALTGCQCSNNQTGGLRFACATQADCAEGFVCRGGECRDQNAPPGACTVGEPPRACSNGCQQVCGPDGGFGPCGPATGPGFSTNPAHCGECGRACGTRLAALTCIDSRCTCAIDSDCPLGTLCAAGGVCVVDTDPCAAVDCPVGQVCRAGLCGAEPCGSGCKPGEVCDTQSGNCRPIDACRFPKACPDGGICEGDPRPDGELCDDANLCTHTDVCRAGVCQGTTYACTPGACQLAAACAGDGGCTATPQPDGTTCNDGVACTMADSCQGGACTGTAYTCTPAACEASSVCTGDGGCAVSLRPSGSACDDGNACTVSDTCDAGSCAGLGYSCPAPTACQQSVACAGDGGCLVTNKPSGATCDDGVACTTNDLCNASQVCSGSAATTYLDADGDGKGDSNFTQQICPTDGGWVIVGGDCNDGDADVSQVVTGLVADLDQDGYTTGTASLQCVGTSQVVNGRTYYKDTAGNFTWLASTESLGADCLDTDADVFNSLAGAGTDADNDGYYVGAAATACVGASSVVNGRTYYANASGAFVVIAAGALGGNECNDADTDVWRNVNSLGADTDQDGYLALSPAVGTQCVGDTQVVSTRTYYRAADGQYTWLASPGLGSDCNDADPGISGPFPWYVDGDADTYGAGAQTISCSSPGSTYVTNNTDCLDTDGDVYRTVASLVADADQDAYAGSSAAAQCVGLSTTVGGRTYYANTSGLYTWMPSSSSLGSDCLDADADVFNNLASSATDADNDGYYVGSLATNCVGTSSVVNGRTYYRSASGVFSFLAAGALGGSDCNDGDLDVFQTVANLGADSDQDGYIALSPPVASQCVGNSTLVAGRTYYRNLTGTYSWLTSPGLGSDCNDADPATFGPFNWYFDTDGDGYGSGSPTVSCASPGAGYVTNNSDCLDSNNLIYQQVPSLVTDGDQDGYTLGSAASQCVGSTVPAGGRTYYRDASGAWTWLASGSSLGSDCDDGNASVGGPPSWYLNNDGDSRGAGTAVVQCASPGLNYISVGGDCNDSNASVYQNIANLMPDADRDGYTTGVAATHCVGAASSYGGRTYYRNASSTYLLPSGSSLGTDCNDANGFVFTTQNNVLQDIDSDGYPYPNDNAQTVCVGNSTTISGRTYYIGTTGTADWLFKNDCLYRSGNSCPYIDCYDYNANARWFQTAFFTVARGDGSFDYDCNGGVVNSPASGTYCGSTASTTFYTEATCVSGAAVATRCVTPTAYASGNSAACGKYTQGSLGYYNPGVCTAAYRVSATIISCH